MHDTQRSSHPPPRRPVTPRNLGGPAASQARKRALGAYHFGNTMKLSVLIPAYNEARTIDEVLRQVAAVPIEKEILVVDDGSVDGTREILAGWNGRDGVRVIL